MYIHAPAAPHCTSLARKSFHTDDGPFKNKNLSSSSSTWYVCTRRIINQYTRFPSAAIVENQVSLAFKVARITFNTLRPPTHTARPTRSPYPVHAHWSEHCLRHFTANNHWVTAQMTFRLNEEYIIPRRVSTKLSIRTGKGQISAPNTCWRTPGFTHI